MTRRYVWRHLVPDESEFPADEVGLSQAYRIPGGDEHRLQALMHAWLAERRPDLAYDWAAGWVSERHAPSEAVPVVLRALLEANPVLHAAHAVRSPHRRAGGVFTASEGATFDLLMGVASRFPVRDIAYFAYWRGGMNTPAEDRARREALRARTGLHLGWVVSPATMRRIEARFFL